MKKVCDRASDSKHVCDRASDSKHVCAIQPSDSKHVCAIQPSDSKHVCAIQPSDSKRVREIREETARALEEMDLRFQRKMKYFHRYNIPTLRAAMECYNKRIVRCDCRACYVVRSAVLNLERTECAFVPAFEALLMEQRVAYRVCPHGESGDDDPVTLVTTVSPSGVRWAVMELGRQLREAYDVTDWPMIQFKSVFTRMGCMV